MFVALVYQVPTPTLHKYYYCIKELLNYLTSEDYIFKKVCTINKLF